MPLGVGVADVIFSAECPRHSSESWNPWGRTDVKTALRLYSCQPGGNGTLYVGVRSDLARRVWQHKNDVLPGVTRGCAQARMVRAA